MGNQTSKEGIMDGRRIKRVGKGNYPQLESNRIIQHTPSKSSSRLGDRKSDKSNNTTTTTTNNNNNSNVVSPVRHQFVLNDHVTPLVSLSAASSFNVYQRRSSGRDTRSMSSTSITSEEGEPNTPTYYTTRSSYDDFTNSFMQDIQQQQKKLSTSLPIKHSDGFIINTSTRKKSDQKPMNENKEEVWVYEYGAEKERDRQTRQHYVLKQVFKGNIHVTLNEPTRILDSACGVVKRLISCSQLCLSFGIGWVNTNQTIDINPTK